MLDPTVMNSITIQRQNPYSWIFKNYKFWMEIIIMSIVPLPFNGEDTFFGLTIVKIPSINWFDTGEDDYAEGSHVYMTPYLSNDFFLAFMFLRFYFIMQTIVILSPPNNKLIGKRILHEHQVEASFTFMMKAAFKERPYLLFCVSAGFVTMALASLVRVFERPYYEFNFGPDKTYYYFSDYSTSVWYMIITMTSVGYGDMVAVTPLGRFVTLIATIVGAFYLALMVAFVTEWLLLSEKQALGMHKVKD